MALFTPRGLKLRLPTAYAFALMARVYPHTDAFRILQLTEEVENLGALAAFLSGIVGFGLRLEPVQVGILVFVAGSVFNLIHLRGLFTRPVILLLSISRIYSFLSGYGALLIGLLIFGFFMVGWEGVLAFVGGRAVGGIVFSIIEFVRNKYFFNSTGIFISKSERSFLHAYRIEATRLGASTDLEVSDDELMPANWGEVFHDLETKWPVVVHRFTRG